MSGKFSSGSRYKQSTCKDDENGDDLLIDYIVFTPYRQYFGHITAAMGMKSTDMVYGVSTH